MAIRHLTYKSIPRQRRKQQAARASAKMREMLQLNPVLTDEQREAIKAKNVHLQKWVNGDLDEGEPPVVVLAAPVHHEVVVEETLGIEEGVGQPKAKK